MTVGRDSDSMKVPTLTKCNSYTYSLRLTHVLGRVHRGLNGRFLLLRNYGSLRVCFVCVLILISISKILHNYKLGMFHAKRTTKCRMNQSRTKGKGWSTTTPRPPPYIPLPTHIHSSIHCWRSKGRTCVGSLMYCLLLCRLYTSIPAVGHKNIFQHFPA